MSYREPRVVPAMDIPYWIASETRMEAITIAD